MRHPLHLLPVAALLALALAACTPAAPAPAAPTEPTEEVAATEAPAAEAPTEEATAAPAEEPATEAAAPALSGVITGTLAYQQRIALAEGAVVEAILLDMNEGPVPMVTSAFTTTGEQVPLPFTIEYDPAAIDPEGFYALGGRILIDGAPRWIVMEPIPALTQGAPLSGFDLPLIDNSEMLAESEGAATTDQAAADQAAREAGVVGGRVSWEGDALPEGALLDVQIYDVSKADAPATIFATTRIEAGGATSPVGFELPVDEPVNDRATYFIGAQVTLDGEVIYFTQQGIPALTNGAPFTNFTIPVAPYTPPATDEGSEGEATAQAVVTGTVTYRQRIALPEGAVVNIQLQDVSRADAAATVLAEQTIVTAGEQVPFAFELPYDPTQIDERFTYIVRATIRIDDKLAFTTDTHTPVITRGAPTGGVELVLVQVP